VNRLVYALPVLGFAVLAFFLFKSLIMPAPEVLPSALIDKPAPSITLAAMDAQTPGFSSADLAGGHVTLVNYFASWCVPCRQEHDTLMRLSKMPGIVIFGIDYQEHGAGAGRAFLEEMGNPFSRIVADDGHEGMEWGVYGVPETYVVDGRGVIRFKYVGPLTSEAVSRELLPAVEKAKLAS
jgi:cytochrome c biogenesis protein CcmG/thiol:disulfide interchange protein DsbE